MFEIWDDHPVLNKKSTWLPVDTDKGLNRLEIKLVIKNKKRVKSTDDCTICQIDFASTKAQTTLPCRHFYHSTCINKWLAKEPKCPICRGNVRQMYQEDD